MGVAATVAGASPGLAAQRPNVVDADAHVVEGGEVVGELLARFPDLVGVRTDGTLGLLIEGRPYPDPDGPGAGCPADRGVTDAPGAHPHTPEGVLADASRDGIGTMVLYPSLAMGVAGYQDREFATEAARLYNRWVASFCAAGGGRLYAAAVAPMTHPDAAVTAMREARELGLVATVVPPALEGWNLDHAHFEPVLAAAEDLDMALAVHGAPGMHLPKIGVDRFTNYIQVHCVSFPFDQMTAMTALVTGGAFDRHPGLRVAFLEAGAGWLPWFVERLDEHYRSRGDWVPGGWKQSPRHYLESGNIMVTCEPDEAMLPAVVEVLGDRCVMFASDYPHWDGAWPNATAEFLEHAGRLPAASLGRVASANARDFYRLA